MSSLQALPRAPTRPDRPGPGPIPGSLLRALDVSIGRRVEGLLAGDYRSAVLGQGTELAQVRPYIVGDDVRQIEWNVTARTGETHVRVQLAERVLVTWLVLDTSPSMQFGTADRRKADVAEGVAIAVGHVASRRGNRLGVVTFGDSHPQAIPPRQGRMGLLGLLAALRAEHAEGQVGATSLGAALQRTSSVARQRALIVVVSDFRGPLRTGAARCSSSPAVTTSSPSRSAIRASRSFRTPASSRSSIPRRADSFASTPAARSSARASPPPPRRSGSRCAGRSPRSASATSSCPRPGTGCASWPCS